MMRQALRVLLIFVFVLAGAGGVDAEQPGLPQPADLTVARGELGQALTGLDAFLMTGTQAKSAGWKRYLQWHELVELSRQPEGDTEKATSLLAKLQANHTGLDMPPFARVRGALEAYVAAASVPAAATTPHSIDSHREDGSPVALTAFQQVAAEPAAAAPSASDRAGLLKEAHQQAPPLAAQPAPVEGNPNLFGYASRRLAAAGVEDNIDQTTGVRDVILGTSLYGTARLTGRTTLVLDENPHVASMRILLGGTAVSRNVGYNGPVTIQTTGVTNISGQKMLAMTAEGLVAYRATACANTNSTIHDICARCGLIERVAWKRAGKQKHQAEAIGSQHAAARVAGQMDAQAGSQVAEQNARYHEKIRDPLLKRGEFPEELAFSSTPERVQVRVLQAAAGLPAAPNAPPAQELTHDAAVRAHESVVINFAQGLLGGYGLTDLRLEKLILEDLETELPEELRVTLPDGKLDLEKDPWSIIFAKELPVSVKFDDGRVAIALRAEGFTRGEGDTPGKYKPAITELLEISADYTIEKTPEGATLKRMDDVRVRFPNRANPDQITIRDSAIVTFIRRKFRNLYKDEFVGQGIELKGRLAHAGKLRLRDIVSDNAWLSVGWQLDGTDVPPASAAE